MTYNAKPGVPATAAEVGSLRGPLRDLVQAVLDQHVQVVPDPYTDSYAYEPVGDEPTMRAVPTRRPNLGRLEAELQAKVQGSNGFEEIQTIVFRSVGLRDYFCRDGSSNPCDDQTTALYWLGHRLLAFAIAVGHAAFDRSGALVVDQSSFDKTFETLRAELTSAHIVRRVIGYLYTTDTERDYTLSADIIVRRSDTSERNHFLRKMYGVEGPKPGPSWIDPMPARLVHGRTVIDISLRGPRSTEWPNATEAIEEAQTALRIAGYNADLIAFFTTEDSIGYRTGTAIGKFEEIPAREWQTITSGGAAVASRAIESLRGSVNRHKVKVPVRRLNFGNNRHDRNDSFIDYMVGLESLLTSQTRSGEITYKLSMRLASIIGNTTDERGEIYRSTKRLYGKRSDVLHGKDANAAEDSNTLRGYLCRVILTVLDLHEPFSEEWADNRILSTAGDGNPDG